MGAGVFVGVIVGVVFRISQDFFGPASLIFGYDPLVAAVVPISVCWMGGYGCCGGERGVGSSQKGNLATLLGRQTKRVRDRESCQ